MEVLFCCRDTSVILSSLQFSERICIGHSSLAFFKNLPETVTFLYFRRLAYAPEKQ